MKAKVVKSKTEKIAQEIDHKVINIETRRAAKASEGLADKLSGDKFHHRNQFYPALQKAFPDCKELHYVERFYPYAHGGPIAVDEVNRLNTPLEIEGMKLKREILAKLGIRYVLLMPDMTELEAMEQLA